MSKPTLSSLYKSASMLKMAQPGYLDPRFLPSPGKPRQQMSPFLTDEYTPMLPPPSDVASRNRMNAAHVYAVDTYTPALRPDPPYTVPDVPLVLSTDVLQPGHDMDGSGPGGHLAKPGFDWSKLLGPGVGALGGLAAGRLASSLIGDDEDEATDPRERARIRAENSRRKLMLGLLGAGLGGAGGHYLLNA